MTALTIRLPDSVHRKVKELAKMDGVSVNQFLASAAAEKVSALLTVDYLREEAKKGSLQRYREILTMIPSGPPDPGDEL